MSSSQTITKQRSKLTWIQQYIETNPLEKLEWDVNDEPDLHT